MKGFNIPSLANAAGAIGNLEAAINSLLAEFKMMNIHLSDIANTNSEIMRTLKDIEVYYQFDPEDYKEELDA